MDWITRIAEDRIQEAIDKGELEAPRYHGKRLELEDYSGIPGDLQMAYKVLKNAGYVPQEVQLQKEIEQLRQEMQGCSDPEQKRRLQRVFQEKTMWYSMMMERRRRPI